MKTTFVAYSFVGPCDLPFERDGLPRQVTPFRIPTFLITYKDGMYLQPVNYCKTVMVLRRGVKRASYQRISTPSSWYTEML